MRSFLNYSKNRFLYWFFKMLIIFILALLFTKVAHAQTINITFDSATESCLNDLSTCYIEDNYNTVLNYYNDNLKNEYPSYFMILNAANLYTLYFYSDSIVFKYYPSGTAYRPVMLSGFIVLRDGSIQKNLYSSYIPTNNGTPVTFTSFPLTKFISFNDVTFENYDSFVYNFNSNTYNYSSFTSLLDFYCDINTDSNYSICSSNNPVPDNPDNPDNPGDSADTSTKELEPDVIYNFLTLICILLILPIIFKFIDNMFHISGRDLE